MELVTKKRLHLVSGRANLPLAEEIAQRLGVTLGNANLAEFANGELHTRFGESVRGTDVFISHRGMIEVFDSTQKDRTVWQPRDADPELEAEFTTI